MTKNTGDIDAIAGRLEQRRANDTADADAAKERSRVRSRRNEQEAAAFAAVAVGQRPKIDLEDRAVRDMPDPYRPGLRPVVMALRDDPLGRLSKRRQIDEAQLAAGRRYQEDFEAAEIAGARAIDTTKECVDGGRFIDPLDDRTIAAAKRLARYARQLGLEGEALVRDVLTKRMTLQQCAAARGMDAKADGREVLYLGRRLRECLETLAWSLGLSVRASHAAVPHDDLATAAEYSDNAELFRAVRRALDA